MLGAGIGADDTAEPQPFAKDVQKQVFVVAASREYLRPGLFAKMATRTGIENHLRPSLHKPNPLALSSERPSLTYPQPHLN